MARHILLDTVADSLIDVNGTGLIAAARANDLCRHGLGDVPFLEGKQRLQTMRLFRILAEPYLFEAQLVDLFFKQTVLRPYPAQIKIVMPEIAAVGLAPNQATFERRNCAHRPHPNHPCTFSTAAALNLHR